MLEKATLLVASYNAMLMVGIALVGIAAATVWTMAKKAQKDKQGA
ncbi:MAG TPA: hypothetical protein V6D05_00850 [Stenomitos sp.]